MSQGNKKLSLLLSLLLAVLLTVSLSACGSSSSSSRSSDPVDPVPPGEVNLLGQPRDGYVGSDACILCHRSMYEGWSATVHGDMIQVASEDTMAPWARDEIQTLIDADSTDPNRKFIEIGRTGGQHLTSLDQILYVVGGKWKQRYVIKTDEGHVFLRGQYYWSKADGSQDHWSEGPDRDDRWNDYNGGRVYEDRCLDCHSTGFDLERADTLDRTAFEYTLGSVVTELGVGCEKCHGPGESHVQTPFKSNILNPGNFNLDQQTAFCASCHGRNAAHQTIDGREDPYGFELGQTTADLHNLVKMLDPTDAENGNLTHKPGDGYYAGSSKRFHDDGASRSHRQEYNDMLQGPHAGKLSCTSCHDVHKGNTLKAATAVALCATCHDGSMAPGRLFTQADIDLIMPKRSQSSNRPDIATHTFRYGALGKPADAVPLKADAAVLPDFTGVNYIGSQTCGLCHTGEHTGWDATVHGDMIRPASDATILAEAKTLLQELIDTTPADDRLTYGVAGNRQQLTNIEEQIAYVVGGKWKQRYVIKTDAGHVFLNGQFYDTPVVGETTPDPRIATYTSARVYEDRCLACHATGFDLDLTASLDRTAPGYELESVVSELGVGCEACHGPGGKHVTTAGVSKDWIINPANFKRADQLQFCASCHGRNSAHKTLAGREDLPGFQYGDKVADQAKLLSVVSPDGDGDWHVTYTPNNDPTKSGYYAGTSHRFWDDGASRSHRQEFNDLEQGPKKGMTCTDCHDVHQGSALKEPFEQLCASCHGPDHGYVLDDVMPKRAQSTNRPDIRTHTFIRDGIEGAIGNPSDDVPLTPLPQ